MSTVAAETQRRWTLPLSKKENTCDGCRECCIAYPLHKNPEYWPEGKKAHEPSRFLNCDGCGIHNQPRPAVCTDFACSYITRNMPLLYRPDKCKVIITQSAAQTFFQGSEYKYGIDRYEGCFLLAETEPRALLDLESAKIKYYAAKKRAPKYTCFIPYGVDFFYGHKEIRIREAITGDVFVMWADSPDYAEEIISWWH
ncbi:MAG: hypothetical protein ACJ8FY_15230 [Gemmataceae bacterium]